MSCQPHQCNLVDPYLEHYRTTSSGYDRYRLDDAADVEATLSILSTLSDLGGAKYLDVGCGTARYVKAANSYGTHLSVGIDRSVDQLRTSGHGQVVAADATMIPFSAQMFDVCSMIMMLQQNSNSRVADILSEVKRTLRSDGLIFVKTRSKADIEAVTFPGLFPSAVSLNFARYQPIEFICDALQAVGFRDIVVQSLQRHRSIPAADYLESVENKHNTTLALLPETEYRSGLARLRTLLESVATVNVPLFHTIVSARS